MNLVQTPTWWRHRPARVNAFNGAPEQPAMQYGANDLHTNQGQVRIVSADGTVVFERGTSPAPITRGGVCGARADADPARVQHEK
jgi:hypothetical protein